MATQNSNAMASVRMRPHAPIEGNSSPEDSRRPRHFDYHAKDRRKLAAECGPLRARLVSDNFDTGK